MFGKLYKQVLTMSIIFLFTMVSCVPAIQTLSSKHEPPPPQGPELQGLDSNINWNEIRVWNLRGLLENAGDKIILDNNDQSSHKLSWAAGAKPTECGFSCVGGPFMSSTTYFTRPNQRIATIFASFDFNLDIDNYPFDRTITTNITINVSCEGWRKPPGEIEVSIHADPPFISSGGGLIEDIINFILLPLDITNSIDAEITRNLSGGQDSFADIPSYLCVSLGVNSTGAQTQDIVLWEIGSDVEETPSGLFEPPSAINLLQDYVEVRFESITRKNGLCPVDPSAGVYFDIFVNGRYIRIPQTGVAIINSSADYPLKDTTVILNGTPPPNVQIIVSDNMGRNGWIQLNEGAINNNQFPTLITHQMVVDCNSLGSGPGSNKPGFLDIHEFEITYIVNIHRANEFLEE